MKVISVQNGLHSSLLAKKSNLEVAKNNYSTLPQNFSKTSVLNFQAYHNISFGLKLATFTDFAVTPKNPLWEKLIARETPFVQAKNDFRNSFEIDSDRILHSGAYSRMRFKTQVFTSPKNDMVSSRLTHVEQVASIAEELAEKMGLNVKLVRAIAKGHDVGHTPFGHAGESKINKIAQEEGLGFTFWHEKNSVRMLEDIETKVSSNGKIENLNLSYATKDGIISHCGEIDENGLKPRSEYVDWRNVEKSDKIMPFTWEGCVMRVSDKIAYIGKDLEDALTLGALEPRKLEELKHQIRDLTGLQFEEVNNSNLIKHFINDLLENSNPKDGLKFSEETFRLMNITKSFNYREIYMPIDKLQTPYTGMVIDNVYKKLATQYDGKNTLENLEKMGKFQPKLAKDFKGWLNKYSDINTQRTPKDTNKVVYSIDNQKDYKRSILEFISGMTDRYATESFESIIFPY